MIERGKAKSDMTQDLCQKLQGLSGPCIQCDDCQGLCPPLIDVLTLPHVIVNRKSEE